ncbi:MAG: XRE family transcriptional regulator [Actinobacteria bacterium]|nr:MAG: XRE family transcriptional regulator [Actinomycetota bacterium]
MGTPVGDMIRQARLQAGFTLEDVASQVGVTPGALSHIESGRRLPYPQNAARIAEVLNLPAEEILAALDEAHSDRRRSAAYDAPPPASASAPRGFRARPITELFGRPDRAEASLASMSASHDFAPSAAPAPSLRQSARWSEDTTERLAALDRMAGGAADAIRTLRGLLDDDDPTVAREARRLLRELDVRLPEE